MFEYLVIILIFLLYSLSFDNITISNYHTIISYINDKYGDIV